MSSIFKVLYEKIKTELTNKCNQGRVTIFFHFKGNSGLIFCKIRNGYCVFVFVYIEPNVLN